MKVNRTNYEVWMIDYFDGKLNAIETAELMSFVDDNLDIKSEFETFESIALDIEISEFNEKEVLKKDQIVATENINETNYDEFFIAFYESDLSNSQAEEVLTFVELNPDLKNEFSFHGKLFTGANPLVYFENKDGLKRKAAIGIYWRITAVAAVILLLFGLGNLIDYNQPNIYEPDRLSSFNNISPKSIAISLQSNPDITIIKKQIRFVNSPADLNAIEDSFEFVAINNMKSQSPQIILIDSKNFSKPIDNNFIDVDLIYALADLNEPKRKGAFGRVIQNMTRRISGNLPEQETEIKENEPKFVKALGRSIVVFNTITGSDTELVKSYDQSGKLTGYQVEGESIAWSRNIASNTD